MATAAIATSLAPVAASVSQNVESKVLCRLTMNDEWQHTIKKNALKNSESKLSPVYELPRETAEEVFGIELSKNFPKISLQMPASKDSDEGRVDKILFFDVTEENRDKIREVLEFTETLYKTHQVSVSESKTYYEYLEKGNVYHASLYVLCVDKERWTAEDKASIESAKEFVQKDTTLSELNSKMQEALKRTWDASEKQRQVAKKHKMWPCHFSICMGNPYNEQ